MSLNADTIALLLAKGLNGEDLLDVARAMECRADPTATERKRRQRAKEKAERDTSQRDVTRDTVSPKERNQTPSGTVLPNEAIASLPIRQPVSEALKVWNENAAVAGWPQAKTMPPNRQKLVASRLREHGIAGWVGAIAKARASPYLSGSDPPTWFTFSWLIKSENFLKLIEGNYDRRHNDSADPTTTALNRFLASAGG